ncbi:MAG TPA: AAA family ATPase [Gemmataceae bacterium]|nr:AAA family ATPase [Gemmataceae bacterium]
MNLKEAVLRAHLSYRVLARETSISSSAIHRIVNFGEYPARIGEEDARRRISAALERRSISVDDVRWPGRGYRPGLGVRLQRASESESTEGIDLMQIDRGVLQHFGLKTNPFENDVETDDDVFPNKAQAQVAAAIRDAIEERGFLAVVAPSGAGKTTIWDGVESEYGRRDDTVICKPKVMSKEKLSPDHITRALIFGLLGEDARIYREGETRGRQLSAALCSNRMTSDRKAVLFIDDAHFCSRSVLRQLKTFYEEKIGRHRLLSIILVGLDDLKGHRHVQRGR